MKAIIGLLLTLALVLSCRPVEESGNHFLRAKKEMVRGQIEARGVTDKKVLGAMLKVPRHEFVPEAHRNLAYSDYPLPIGEGQTISQPYIVALMTEALGLKGQERVLEIGTGSGYQAAVLAEIVPEVYTIEINTALGKSAAERLSRLGYDRVKVRIGDGYLGWPEQAPFEGIMVTCAPEDVPQPLVEQLAEGGRIVIPVGGEGQVQTLYLLTKTERGVEQKAIIPVRFVPMTGEAQRKAR